MTKEQKSARDHDAEKFASTLTEIQALALGNWMENYIGTRDTADSVRVLKSSLLKRYRETR